MLNWAEQQTDRRRDISTSLACDAIDSHLIGNVIHLLNFLFGRQQYPGDYESIIMWLILIELNVRCAVCLPVHASIIIDEKTIQCNRKSILIKKKQYGAE